MNDTPARRHTDKPAAGEPEWRWVMHQRIAAAEAAAGVELTPEWRRFFVELGNPDTPPEARNVR